MPNTNNQNPEKQIPANHRLISTAHLWKPGQSGNPTGRPENEKCVTSILRMLLSANGGKRAQKVASALLTQAENGNIAATQIVLDRVEGKVIEKVSIENDTEKALLARLNQIKQIIDKTNEVQQIEGKVIDAEIEQDFLW